MDKERAYEDYREFFYSILVFRWLPFLIWTWKASEFARYYARKYLPASVRAALWSEACSLAAWMVYHD